MNEILRWRRVSGLDGGEEAGVRGRRGEEREVVEFEAEEGSSSRR